MITKRQINYIITNGVFCACIYLGFYKGIDGFKNVALFIAWVTSISVWVLLNDEVRRTINDRLSTPSFPEWFDNLFDVAVTMVFVYYSRYILGVFYLIHILILKYAREKAKEELKNEQTKTTNQQ